MLYCENKRLLHDLLAKYKILHVPHYMRHNGDSILTPQGVILFDEGYSMIDGHAIHVSGISESTWEKYGVGLYGHKVVMDVLRARSLGYDYESQTLRLFASFERTKQSLESEFFPPKQDQESKPGQMVIRG